MQRALVCDVRFKSLSAYKQTNILKKNNNKYTDTSENNIVRKLANNKYTDTSENNIVQKSANNK